MIRSVATRALLIAVGAVVVSACSSGGVGEVSSEPTSTAPSEALAAPAPPSDSSVASESDPPSSSVSDPDEAQVAGGENAAPGDTAPGDTAPAPPTTALEQEPLPGDCRGLDPPLLPAQLTFVAEGKLIARGLNGESVCLIELGADAGVGIVEWGAQGDRVMFTNGRVDILGVHGRAGGVAGPEGLAFSWPTGFNMVWLRNGIVQKSTADDRQQRDLEIGLPVTEVSYHPDGQFLLIVADDGSSGSRVLATDSEGELAASLIVSADARISELSVAANGSSLVFSAEHADGAIHIHSLELAEVVVSIDVGDDEVERTLGVTDEVLIKTVFEAGSTVNNIVFDMSGEQIAFAVGDCATGSTIDLVDLVAGGYPLPIDPLFSARPVGFVTATELAILVYDESCAGGDLYLADTVTGETELVRAGVDGASVRQIAPPARFSLVGVELTDQLFPDLVPNPGEGS